MSFTVYTDATVGFTRKELRNIAILIPVVGIFISSLFAVSNTHLPWVSAFYYILHAIFMTAGIWGGCAVIVGVLWHKYPWEKYPVKHLVVEIISIFLWVGIFSFTVHSIETWLNVMPRLEDMKGYNPVMDIAVTFLITFLITTIHEAVYFYKQWKLNFSKSARLEKDNIEAKYETLKSQINPHFLFNSLNSLALIVDENEEATDYIQNLSEFLRYVLKSRDRELVLVRDEVVVLQKYFSLQKSRFRNNLIVDLNIEERFYHYSLPPLVLQMLVENCIKHNVISKSKPLTVKVFANNGNIIVENNLQKKNAEVSTKQGLRNITDRLAFFTNKEVVIQEKTDMFRVSIPLLTVEL